MTADVIVIGGGCVGAAIGYGLAGLGVEVLVLDGEDRDFRAANANFGLVWSQGKGLDMPDYQRWTRESIDRWPEFSAELTSLSGLDLQYDRRGGLMICLGETEFERRRETLARLHNQMGGMVHAEMIDRSQLERLLPKVEFGAEVTGAGFAAEDGHANPLKLLTALHAGILARGGRFRGGKRVHSIRRAGGQFDIQFGEQVLSARKIVIAAGLGSKGLAAEVGLDIPIRPQRGQILVTERCEPFLPLPMSGLRQTREGTVMIGATHDGDDYDSSTTGQAAMTLSCTAVRRIPALAKAKLVRQWSGLRIMTPDTYPIYAESTSHPGAFVALCHSGVTLAAAHAGTIAEAVANGGLPPSLAPFHQRRFDVSQTA